MNILHFALFVYRLKFSGKQNSYFFFKIVIDEDSITFSGYIKCYYQINLTKSKKKFKLKKKLKSLENWLSLFTHLKQCQNYEPFVTLEFCIFFFRIIIFSHVLTSC